MSLAFRRSSMLAVQFTCSSSLSCQVALRVRNLHSFTGFYIYSLNIRNRRGHALCLAVLMAYGGSTTRNTLNISNKIPVQ